MQFFLGENISVLTRNSVPTSAASQQYPSMHMCFIPLFRQFGGGIIHTMRTKSTFLNADNLLLLAGFYGLGQFNILVVHVDVSSCFYFEQKIPILNVCRNSQAELYRDIHMVGFSCMPDPTDNLDSQAWLQSITVNPNIQQDKLNRYSCNLRQHFVREKNIQMWTKQQLKQTTVHCIDNATSQHHCQQHRLLLIVLHRYLPLTFVFLHLRQ